MDVVTDPEQLELPGAAAVVTPVSGWCPWCPHTHHPTGGCSVREGASGWRCPCTGRAPEVER